MTDIPEPPTADTTLPAYRTAEIAAYLAARMCHDFISPASAIVSGLDLLEDPSAQDMREDAMSLIAASAHIFSHEKTTHHFRLYAPEKIPYAIDRYSNEAKRLYGVLDTRLKESEYVAADEYTIADIAIFPWLRSWQNQGIDWADFPHAKAWFDRVAARPAVQRGVEVLAGLRKPLRDDKAREVLFGAQQYRRH